MIVIKSMTELPERCYGCPCRDGESGYCQADEEYRYSDYRPFWCPLVKIKQNDEVIDKIRSEIVHLHDWAFSREEILRIIDKYKSESEVKMNKEDTKRAIIGFTEFFKGITGNQDLKIPDDIAKEYDIEQNEKSIFATNISAIKKEDKE